MPAAWVVATVVVVAATALVVDAPVLLAGGVLCTVLAGLARSRPAAGTQLVPAGTAASRSVLVPTVVLALGLHVLGAHRTSVDQVLVLGAVAGLVGAAAAVVAAHRRRVPRVVVVGDLPQVRGLVARWLHEHSVDVVGGLVLGSPDLTESGLGDLGIAPVGTVDDVVRHLDAHPADLVVVAAGAAASGHDVRRLSWALEHHPTRLALMGVTEHVAPHRIALGVVGGSTVFVVARPGAGAVARLAKPVLDRVLALVLAVVALPLLAAAALAIRLDSGSPALFHQTRIGRDGRPFTLYKLRTMTCGAEQAKAGLVSLDQGNGVLFKIHDDPRVTRVGRWLRRTSIDELPQLFNVLNGTMSLVGPRPALPEEVAAYTDLERRRLAVMPGLTGPWQVSGRSLLSRERSMRIDTAYADNWRLRGDLLILLRTVTAVVSRRGAY